jgi:hypothetical protein
MRWIVGSYRKDPPASGIPPKKGDLGASGSEVKDHASGILSLCEKATPIKREVILSLPVSPIRGDAVGRGVLLGEMP